MNSTPWFGIHVANKGWIPDSGRYPNKSPNETFQVPRYLFPQHAYLSKRVPECVSSLIINFAYLIGPRARVNATIIHDYAVADDFYKLAINDELPRIFDPFEITWFPHPYLHPLRKQALRRHIDWDDIPWAANQVH